MPNINSCSPIAGWITFIASVLFVIAGGYAAWKDEFLTVGQMLKHGDSKGLPFITHGGMWGNLVPISLILGASVYLYGSNWSKISIIGWLVMGTTVSIYMHKMYINGGCSVPEAHTHGGKLTPAGIIHAIYMAWSLTIIFLLYFNTRGINPTFLICTSVALGIHIFIGNHMILGFIKPSWCGWDYIHSKQGWATILVSWAILGITCYMKLEIMSIRRMLNLD